MEYTPFTDGGMGKRGDNRLSPVYEKGRNSNERSTREYEARVNSYFTDETSAMIRNEKEGGARVHSCSQNMERRHRKGTSDTETRGNEQGRHKQKKLE